MELGMEMFWKNTLNMNLVGGLFFFGAYLASFTAHAAPVIFFGKDTGSGNDAIRPTSHLNSDAARDDFMSHLQGTYTENFESFATGSVASLSLNFGVDTATLKATSGTNVHKNLTSTYGGAYPMSGNNILHILNSNNSTINFSASQVAFGFYMTDLGDGKGVLKVLFDGVAYEVPSTAGSPSASTFYFGFIDTENPFTTITFNNSNPADGYGLDDLTIGDIKQVVTVPEPAMLGLLGVSIIGMNALRRRTTGA